MQALQISSLPKAKQRKRLAIIVLATLAVLAVCVVFGIVQSAWGHGSAVIVAEGGVDGDSLPAISSDGAASGNEESIFVHVLGAVTHPGVYQLPAQSRVIDAITAAGGATDTAELASVNLARQLSDGEQIRVLNIGEEPPPEVAGGGSGETSGGGAASGKINLNQATSEQLQALPGVGPATAERIITWRENNGRFSSVDELIAVSGIGPKTLAQIRDHATV